MLNNDFRFDNETGPSPLCVAYHNKNFSVITLIESTLNTLIPRESQFLKASTSLTGTTLSKNKLKQLEFCPNGVWACELIKDKNRKLIQKSMSQVTSPPEEFEDEHERRLSRLLDPSIELEIQGELIFRSL